MFFRVPHDLTCPHMIWLVLIWSGESSHDLKSPHMFLRVLTWSEESLMVWIVLTRSEESAHILNSPHMIWRVLRCSEESSHGLKIPQMVGKSSHVLRTIETIAMSSTVSLHGYALFWCILFLTLKCSTPRVTIFRQDTSTDQASGRSVMRFRALFRCSRRCSKSDSCTHFTYSTQLSQCRLGSRRGQSGSDTFNIKYEKVSLLVLSRAA